MLFADDSYLDERQESIFIFVRVIMLKIVYVGIGGCIGSALRYAVSIYTTKLLTSQLPYGTLIVNAAGGFLIGFIMDLCLSSNISTEFRLFLTTGILGGFTTFSTFSYETIGLFSAGNNVLGIINICLNLFLSLGGVIFGKLLADVFVRVKPF